MSPRFDPVTGRYLRLDIGGRPHRLYVEEAGQGIPLLCLHTAGADGRQYRDLLLDEAVTSRFRVIAFDMPWHGKSSPPEGWQDEEYRLSTEAYVGMILDVCAALDLDRPVVLGCSIGGRIVLQLAADHPERFRGLIGAQGAAWQDPWYDTDWLHRPDVHGGEVCAALISGLIAPGGPAADRHETLWHYMQGGPGVFKGDLWFYRVDGDLRDTIARIDTARCPLWLMAGEYDFSCRPEDMIATAEAIPGCQAVVMERLGHFPMSENYGQFARSLTPILEEISGPVPTAQGAEANQET
ncbi:alpha/beta fold hydrolase [Pseudooceanicola sp. 200-1SW]|uniref:alpha/beta fold hydrolase n=1 Tax=Pseudooceanicola sp. 200-1SW TaxID=3425949 RepID=UPI003D7F662A